LVFEVNNSGIGSSKVVFEFNTSGSAVSEFEVKGVNGFTKLGVLLLETGKDSF